MKNKFTYISSFLKSKNRRITPLLDSNDQLVYSDGEIAQLFGNKFSSVHCDAKVYPQWLKFYKRNVSRECDV